MIGRSTVSAVSLLVFTFGATLTACKPAAVAPTAPASSNTTNAESGGTDEAVSDSTPSVVAEDGPDSSVSDTTTPAPAAEAAETTTEAVAVDEVWHDLFDGQSLKGWKSTNFGGEGEVHVEDEQIILPFGQPMTGINYEGGDLPTTDYELRLEAMRVDGTDFFCALTFPVADSHCSLVVGGWGGSVVGLSSIDGEDASENETTSYQTFENSKWYALRIRVTEKSLQAWIDDKRVINQDIEGRELSLRIEVELSKPLGIASFDTQAALRNIQYRKLAAATD